MFKKYLPIFIVLLLFHYLFSNWMLIITWCLLGVLFARWFTNAPHPVLAVVCMEITIGIIYWFAFWMHNDAIYELSNRFGISVMTAPLTVVAVNVFTAFLCTTSFYYLLKRKQAYNDEAL